MSYTRTTWIARVGTALNRFLKTNETSTEVELTNDPTGVSVPGTPFTVANMNKIEQGIYDAHVTADANTSNLLANVNQGVKTTDSPTFANATIGGHNVDSELDTLNSRVNQALTTSSSPTFASVNTTSGPNKPIDNNGATPPAIGIGGFTYAAAKGNDGLTLPSGGTYVVLALSISTGSSSGTGVIYRLSGGTYKIFIGSNDNVGYLIMRIG